MQPKDKREDERRSKFRFTIQRELRYKMLDEGAMSASGIGQTIDIASAGVAFVAEHPLKLGAFVELSISWPVLLDDTCPMRLIIFGRVLRSAGKKSVSTIDKYEFRTQSRTIQALGIPRSDGMLQRWADGIRKESLKASQAGA